MTRRASERSSLGGHGSLAEINVTPLLDLAFVLLIIFIITTPFLESTVDLIIPTSAVDRPATDEEDLRFIAVDRFGNVSLDDVTLSLDEVTAQLSELASSRPNAAVVVRAHKELPIQELIDIMDALERARITRVGVMTAPEAASQP